MIKTYKYRIYPTDIQKELLSKHFGCVRFVYNWALQKKIEEYQKDKTKLSCYTLINMMQKLKSKEETDWLNEVNSQSLQSAINNLDHAFTKFFKEKKGFPKFKSKKKNKDSFQCPQNVKVCQDKNRIDLPKIKNIDAIIHRPFDGKIKTVTVSKKSSGKYYVSILVDNKEELPSKKQIKEKTAIGIDLGLKHFCILSDGTKIENPKYLKQSEIRLKILQQRLSKKTKGGKNRGKCNLKVAKLHEKISNQRKDFQHKLSNSIVKNYDSICVENLQVQNMIKNHCLAKSISDVGWSQFITYLNYKSEWYGKNLIKIGTFEPSSKMCSCGVINNDLKLNDRIWTCKICGTKHDRDILAANNIKRFALQKQNLANTVGTTGRACGDVNNG